VPEIPRLDSKLLKSTSSFIVLLLVADAGILIATLKFQSGLVPVAFVSYQAIAGIE